MRVFLAPLLLMLALGGCAGLKPAAPPDGWTEAAAPASGPVPRPEAGAVSAPVRIAPAGARTAAAFDRTSAEDKAAALAAPASGAELGQVTVSLGNPAEQGFWLRSGLVTAPRPGVVRLPSGASAQVDLLPSTGGGAQLSLAAYRALGLGLTDLPLVTVLGR